jgi:hypothetical protein
MKEDGDKKTNRLIFCQYCSKIFLFAAKYSAHIKKKRYHEYKKEVELYVDEVQVCLAFY